MNTSGVCFLSRLSAGADDATVVVAADASVQAYTAAEAAKGSVAANSASIAAAEAVTNGMSFYMHSSEVGDEFIHSS